MDISVNNESLHSSKYGLLKIAHTTKKHKWLLMTVTMYHRIKASLHQKKHVEIHFGGSVCNDGESGSSTDAVIKNIVLIGNDNIYLNIDNGSEEYCFIKIKHSKPITTIF